MGTGDHNAEEKRCDGLVSHPGGSRNIPSRFMLRKPELSAGLMGHLARMQTLPLPLPPGTWEEEQKARGELGARVTRDRKNA